MSAVLELRARQGQAADSRTAAPCPAAVPVPLPAPLASPPLNLCCVAVVLAVLPVLCG
jgi:hypothetical protein